MKRILLFALAVTALLSIAAVALDLRLNYGYGSTVSVTTNQIERVAFAQDTNHTWFAYEVSINNTGSSVVYVGKNITTNDFQTVLDATNAIPVPADTTFTFSSRMQLQEKIRSVCLYAASGTNSVYVAAY